jgi:uroporphyrinogen decarboxylase
LYMNSIDRFIAATELRSVDKLPIWLGMPTTKALPALLRYFKVASETELRIKLHDDIFPVEIPYHSPTSNAIYDAFDFAKKFKATNEERTLTAAGFFEDYTDPSRVDDFAWPDPEQYIDLEECRKIVRNAPEGMVILGVVWSAHFQDTCAAFGMENALITLLTEPQMFQAISQRIEAFYLKANEIFYEASKGYLHAILIGNDLGSQTSLILSPEHIRKYVLPGTKKFVEQAKRYGLKVIHHSCGAIHDIIPDLIDIGVDVIHPMQVLAKGMQPRRLFDDFGNKVCFCGGIDAQHLLVNGTEEDIYHIVGELNNIFKTGLILSPSHEAILPDVRPSIIEAMFRANGNLVERS